MNSMMYGSSRLVRSGVKATLEEQQSILPLFALQKQVPEVPAGPDDPF